MTEVVKPEPPNVEPIDLWLDDIREPAQFGCLGFLWVKTYEEAIAVLQTGRVRRASLDHDLSEMATIGQTQDGEKTGYDVVCWMEQQGIWPSEWTRVHSQNPAGKRRMEQVIYRRWRRE